MRIKLSNDKLLILKEKGWVCRSGFVGEELTEGWGVGNLKGANAL